MADLFNNSGDFLQTLANSRGQYDGIQTPNLTWNTYSPDQVAPRSSQATTVQDDPMVKSAQMSALAKMGDLSNTGLSDVDQQGYAQARDLGNQMANSGTQAAMQNANARGIGGSGTEFAQREIANQQGAQRSQQAGLQQASDSARQRALYNQAYSNALGGMQQQQTGLNAQNAGILNQFNQANTNAANQAQYYNTGNNNQAQLTNTQGRNNVAQGNFNNQLGLAGAIQNSNKDLAGGQAAADAAATAQFNQIMSMGIGAVGMGM